MTDTTATDQIRTVYMSEEDKDALPSIASLQKVSASEIVRAIFDDYLAGKLEVTKPVPAKTSIYIDTEKWAAVRAKTAVDKVPISLVIAAGMRRLRGR
jgi:hypothetical protein